MAHNDKTEAREDFKISKIETADGLKLVISPVVANAGFKPVSFAMTLQQWDSLRYHFATKVYDAHPGKLVELAYII